MTNRIPIRIICGAFLSKPETTYVVSPDGYAVKLTSVNITIFIFKFIRI